MKQKNKGLRWAFVLRGMGLALFALTAAGLGGWLLVRGLLIQVPYGPLSPEPEILAPAGDLPTVHVGLEQWARYSGQPDRLVGSGFLLALPDGAVLAATAAHSVTLGDPANLLVELRLAAPDAPGRSFEAQRLHGKPGRPRVFGRDLRRDYVLLQVTPTVDRSYLLIADDRGGPQEGERVILYPGAGAQTGAQLGAVLLSAPKGAWVLMDESFDPALMSGSPFLSVHTGRVVGMAVAAGAREGRLVIGMTPIGSLIEAALLAREFPLLADL